VLERTLYVHVYRKPHLDQVLFTIGLVFMSVAAVDYVMGSGQVFARTPSWLEGQINLFGRRPRPLPADDHPHLRRADHWLAADPVEDALRQPAARLGRRCPGGARARHQRVGRVRAHFAFGSGLAGLGGALGVEILGLDPTFPLKYMIYFLIVVTVGGTSSITGPFLASLLLGIGDVAGKYYVPTLGRVRLLHHHDRGADLAAARPVRARCSTMRCGALGNRDTRPT
jgi:branched-chain amino acid transport system permease protein